MMTEQLEFQISQYLDGTLAAEEIAALEEVLRKDPEAQALLEEYRRLDGVLKTALPMPAVQWDRLASRISEAVAEEAEAPSTYKIGFQRFLAPVAIAASLLIATAVGIRIYLSQDANTPVGGNVVAIVQGPSIEKSNSPIVQEIKIGPSATFVSAPEQWHGIANRPSRMIGIARVEVPAQDTDRPF